MAPLAVVASNAVLQSDRGQPRDRVTPRRPGGLNVLRVHAGQAPPPCRFLGGLASEAVPIRWGPGESTGGSAVQIMEALASTRVRKRSSPSFVERSARFRAVTSAITMPTPLPVPASLRG